MNDGAPRRGKCGSTNPEVVNIGSVTVTLRSRSPAAGGNERALAIMDQLYEICDRPWRGLGIVPRGGFQLREKWSRFDAEKRYSRQLPVIEFSCECRSAEVLFDGSLRHTLPSRCAAQSSDCICGRRMRRILSLFATD